MNTESLLSITQDVYFDVAKHAKAWGVAHEDASEIIQKELFKAGCGWAISKQNVQFTSENILIVRGPMITWASEVWHTAPTEATLQASTTYTLHIEQPEPEEEIVEEDNEIIQLMGKKYSKADIEAALRLLTPKEEE